jgi:glycosyltransferase involved in cell wall biosynthesis
MQPGEFQNARPRILTNMAFWQSPAWVDATDSIYPVRGAASDPDFLPAWREALALWRRAPGYDVVLTMGARESLLYALLCFLTFRPSKQIMTEVFIDAPKKASPSWLAKRAIYRAAARRSIGVLTNSLTECDTISRRYDIPKDRLLFVPLNSNIAAPEMSPVDDGFVLSAGRSLRDYATLARAARTIDKPFVIVGGSDDLARGDLPPNVKMLREIPREAYLDHLRRCSIVVIPLLPTERATGQVVCLEAMAFGKPVVATRAPGITDYIQDGVDGALVEPGNADALAGAVRKLLDDPTAARRMAFHALEKVKREFSMDRHTQRKLDAIRELWSRHR